MQLITAIVSLGLLTVDCTIRSLLCDKAKCVCTEFMLSDPDDSGNLLFLGIQMKLSQT